MDAIYAKYKSQVEFFMVYIKEAHPTDGWVSPANVRAKILIKQPTTMLERTEVAQKMCSVLKITLPALVDSIDDKTSRAYSAAPDRIYLIGVDGKIAYQGGRGPRGFDAGELRVAIEEMVAAPGESDRSE